VDAAQAVKEKQHAAATSGVAAVGLTGFKLLIGLTTGSLGILAEAAHSGLDLAAAIMTWFAVRLSGRPADHDHLYGHGKIENLSALLETFLLLITCFWIISEAVQRLVSGGVVVEVNIWSFAVMIISIVVDYSRSRMLYRVARKHNSQALEADALHFSTDIWSSSVVLVGLSLLLLSRRFSLLASLRSADSIAAILVAVICLYVIYKLGLRTILALLDTAPAGMDRAITTAVESLPGVGNCHKVRVRTSGAQLFVDVHVLVDGGQTLEQAHALTEEIERAIQQVAPNSDVTVHPEPR
jgi:cation diffusion facilitator family transporter